MRSLIKWRKSPQRVAPGQEPEREIHNGKLGKLDAFAIKRDFLVERTSKQLPVSAYSRLPVFFGDEGREYERYSTVEEAKADLEVRLKAWIKMTDLPLPNNKRD